LIEGEKPRTEIEAILIGLTTAGNGTKPKIKREKLRKDVVSRIKKIRRGYYPPRST
jgi:hypothetical protein